MKQVEEWSVKVAKVTKLWLTLDALSARVYLNREQARNEKGEDTILLPVPLTASQQKVVNGWLNASAR